MNTPVASPPPAVWNVSRCNPSVATPDEVPALAPRICHLLGDNQESTPSETGNVASIFCHLIGDNFGGARA